MKNKCLRAIAQYNMINPGDRVLVALSGGADSVALLHFLHANANELDITVAAAHFNHGIRGLQADEDALFCEQFCRQYGIEFIMQKSDIPTEATKRGLGTEECARLLRYEFLHSAANGAKIATAHTNSDSCESFLFNFARGTGLQGLCGIPAVRGQIIRPFVFCSAEETRQYCSMNNLLWREDSTNSQTQYARNRIRLEAIPPLKQVNGSFEDNALRCMQILQSENDFLQSETLRSYAQCKDADGAILLGSFMDLHPAIATRVLKHYVENCGCENVSMHQISLLMESACGDVVTFSNAIRFKKDKNKIFLVKPEPVTEQCSICVSFEESVVPFFDTYVYFKQSNYNIENIGKYKWVLDANKVGSVVLRNRRAGDSIRLPKRNCTKTLKHLFTEKKIPVSERDRLPILADENGVIWVAQFGVDESRIPDENTKNIIIIEWRQTI